MDTDQVLLQQSNKGNDQNRNRSPLDGPILNQKFKGHISPFQNLAAFPRLLILPSSATTPPGKQEPKTNEAQHPHLSNRCLHVARTRHLASPMAAAKDCRFEFQDLECWWCWGFSSSFPSKSEKNEVISKISSHRRHDTVPSPRPTSPSEPSKSTDKRCKIPPSHRTPVPRRSRSGAMFHHHRPTVHHHHTSRPPVPHCTTPITITTSSKSSLGTTHHQPRHRRNTHHQYRHLPGHSLSGHRPYTVAIASALFSLEYGTMHPSYPHPSLGAKRTSLAQGTRADIKL